MKNIETKISIVAIVFTVGIAAVAFAHGWNGSGYGGYMMGPGMMGYGPGYGGNMMGYGPYGYGNLSPQDTAKLEQSQQKFLNDTIDLRNSIQEKQFALNQEIQKTNPDRDNVNNLQKELSQLESQFDQKALEYQLDLRKNFPETALSMGYGRGGYCW